MQRKVKAVAIVGTLAVMLAGVIVAFIYCYSYSEGPSLRRLDEELTRRDVIAFGHTLPPIVNDFDEMLKHLYRSGDDPGITFKVSGIHGGLMVNNAKDGQLPVHRCNGLLYVVSHKWVNQCAGLVYVLSDDCKLVEDKPLYANQVKQMKYEKFRPGVFKWVIDMD